MSQPREALTSTGPVIVCLYDYRTVREVLETVGDELAHRTVINLTTTTPREARDLSNWLQQRHARHLDGAIMAIPEGIGNPEAHILYSGSHSAFDDHRDLLAHWGRALVKMTILGSHP